MQLEKSHIEFIADIKNQIKAAQYLWYMRNLYDQYCTSNLILQSMSVEIQLINSPIHNNHFAHRTVTHP